MTDDEIKPTEQDVRDAQRLLRALTGGEPYAPHVYPTAREIARLVAERRAELVAAIDKAWSAAAREMEVVGPPYAERVVEHLHEALQRAVSQP